VNAPLLKERTPSFPSWIGLEVPPEQNQPSNRTVLAAERFSGQIARVAIDDLGIP
jgi:hypothetical protein